MSLYRKDAPSHHHKTMGDDGERWLGWRCSLRDGMTHVNRT